MKKLLFVVSIALSIGAAYLGLSEIGSGVPDAEATKVSSIKYLGKIYVAGMGGHFAVADVEIDPGAATPIKIKDLDRIVIGSKDTHPTHDPRIDVNDRTKLYWSTYKTDKEEKGKVFHVGISDLKTGDVIMDKTIEVPERAQWINALYCASGQTRKSYIPLTMTNESFIDVFSKDSLELKHRIYLDTLGYENNYFFFHGTSSPDMKYFALTINRTKPWAKQTEPAPRLGKIDMLLLDLPALEQGDVKVIAKNTITGSPEKTLTFRQSFTPDGKYLLQSGADRFYLLKADDMTLIDEEMMTDGENHEAISTPYGRYAVLTLRTRIKSPEGKTITDGQLQLYDINARKLVGKPVSTCYACHKEADVTGNATLCGADVNWKI